MAMKTLHSICVAPMLEKQPLTKRSPVMILRSLLSATALALVTASTSVAQSNNSPPARVSDQVKLEFSEAEALRRGDGVPIDLQRSFELFEKLAAKDHARSIDRVGLAAWRGKGTVQDLDLAEEMFRKAIASGHTKSLVNLGRLLSEVGRGPEALAAFQQASNLKLSGAELWIARGHVNGLFGDLSTPQVGQKALEEMSAAGDTKATFALADALRGDSALESDKPRSLMLFEKLAETGDANALYRVGTAYMRGIGTEPDLERAIVAYRASADAGRTGALINLGRALSDAGHGAAARETFEQAMAAGVKRADLWLGRGHFERRFGKLESNNPLGADMLFEQANAGSLDAAAVVVKNTRKRVFSRRNYTGILSVLDEGVARNEGKAIETLIAYYRLRHRARKNTLELRRSLLETKGEYISPVALLSEKIELAADFGPQLERWKKVDELLSAVDGPLYERGLITAYKAERRAYTYHLQRNLADRGFYSGKVSGLMTKGTVKAFRRYCKSEGIDDVCRHGPLRVDAIRAMAQLWG